MSTPPLAELPPEPMPPTEARRALHASLLGGALGIVLALLGRRR